MSTNPDTGVSIDDVAALLESDPAIDKADEPKTDELAEDVAEGDDPEAKAKAEDETSDVEDVEFEGKAYKVPKELKNALLRQSDYTQKTQEVAAARRELEEQAQVFRQEQQLSQQAFDKRVELRGIQGRLSQFEQIDWQKLVDEDPVQATKLNLEYQQLQRTANQKAHEVQQVTIQTQHLAEQSRQQKLQKESAELMKHIPDFKSVEAKVVETAKSFGYTEAELHAISVLNPDSRALRVLHAAMQWQALQAAKPQAMQKIADAPRVVKPAASQSQNHVNAQRSDRLNARFRSGKAGLNDLAAYLDN